MVITLRIVHHGPKGDQEVVPCLLAQPSASWGYWFNKIDNLTLLGKHTLTLTTMINESNATSFGGRELPSFKLKFTIKEGSAESFVIHEVSSALHVGVPFDIPLSLKDGCDHPATPPSDLKPVLNCRGLDLSYERVDSKGTTFTIRSVTARGKVLTYQQSKAYDLKVTLPGLKKDTQTIKISLLPGIPHSLHVMPEDDPITVENGQPVTFNVEVHDESGNITTHPGNITAHRKQIVSCQVQGFPKVTTDCSTTGAGQLVTKPIDLKIIKGEPQEIKVHFEMPNRKKVELVARTLNVVPSTRVTHMELCSKDDLNLELRNNDHINCVAGGSLKNLFYKLYDEASREVPPTAEIASKIKVNWTGDVNMKDLVQGKLPDIQVPTQVQEERFCHVSYQDLSVSFSIMPCPNKPTRLKATLLQSTVKLGEILPGNISLELVDQYDNTTKTLPSSCVSDITVEAEGLHLSSITFGWQESTSSVLVSGIQFQSGTPGSREMTFTYRSFVERVIVKVTAGVPAQLKLINGPLKPLQVLNDKGISTPFVIQLCDEWGNPSTDQRVVVQLKSSPPTLKVKTAVTSQPVNAEGKASFTVNSVSGQKGCYQLEFKGSFNHKPIPGPSVSLTVIPDANKPVSLSVEYDTDAKILAGDVFPVFSVAVLSDEGSPITTINPAAVSMWLWAGESSEETPPQTATELKCCKPRENERNDCFHFRDKEIPKQVGKHIIQFSVRVDQTHVLFSNQITVNVMANQPVKLAPDSQPPTAVVSYSENIANRTLVENMTLRITDSYGNPTGKDLDGNVVVSMKNVNGDNSALPLFEGNTNLCKMSLVEGEAHIPRLAIMENSPGEDGSTYVLVFKPEVMMVPTPLAAFKLRFQFYNDAENQQKMSELTRRKDAITSKIAKYEEMFASYHEMSNMLTKCLRESSIKESDLRNVLVNRNMEEPQTIPDIDRLIRQKNTEAQRIQQAPRRVFSSVDHFRGQQDVVGMVGHLAFVEDDDAARVISWHISGDMNCVITKTTAAAKRIYANTQGRQEVMGLDSVFVGEFERPMPHMRNGRRLFDPPGNPVFARDLLISPHDPQSCKKAFRNILGDTILIDDLNSGNNYRMAVVGYRMSCPTILTRQGDRISAKGKFGGTRNKAPPISALEVFGAPLPQQYYTLQEHIDLLRQYRVALERRNKATMELDEHLKKMRSPAVLTHEQQMEENKKELEEIKRQLASTRARPEKRSLEEDGEPSSVIPKRARQRSV